MRHFLIVTKQAAVKIQSCKYKLINEKKKSHMLSVKYFKMQVQKPSLKRSFYCSAHVQDIILVYLIPKCRETITKTLAGTCCG